MHQDRDVVISVEYEDSRVFTRTVSVGRKVTEARDGVPYRCQRLHLDSDSIRRPVQIESSRELSATGENLANVLATLSRARQQEVAERFCRLVPVFKDMDVGPHEGATDPGQHTLRGQDRWSSVRYGPHAVSDGSLLVLALLSLPYQEPPPDIVAIEEPEHGIHPYLIGESVNLLRQLCCGGQGTKAVQIVLATHSPAVLDHLKPEEVRFLRRKPEDGSVLVEEPPIEHPESERAFQEYEESLGSVWLSGGLGGVPGS
jgi:predicted ATPase